MVDLRVEFKRMVSFEQSEQQLKVIVNIEMLWRDEYLTWNPANHSGVDILFLPIEKIWRYDLTLYSSVGRSPIQMDHNVAFVRPDGTVTWFSAAVLHSSCLVRVKYFPFDKQYCRLIVASWTYDNTSVTLIQNTENVRKKYFINNGVWDLSSIHKEYQILNWECCPNEWVEAHYLLLFTRQSRYYVITVIVPSTTLSLVSLLVFFMPPDSEEKVTLASSNLLAMLLFQELVSTSMPPIGNQFPLIGSFFVASIVINTFSIFTSIMIMYLHNKDDRPVPSWVQKLAMLKTASKQSQPVDTRPNWVKRRLSGFISTSTISKAVHLHHTQDSSGQNAIGTNLISSRYLELSSVAGLKKKAQEDKMKDNATDEASELSKETKEEIVAQWQELSLKVNRIMAFLLTSSVITTALVITFLYIAQEEGDFPERT
ncbi:neuronal acetylcholine receptor subunit alpha-9-like [Lytechinus variegatus]|uniref:neuronal acetylcholine receptor subunit alpha-9-like n=1 Tax=Lytechinus variegatus TaxID=7654 RepID=UPI001BB10B78|nr:neuronal acetylcholine receptor subunit alpha-9-like [Lytechinus variegatus]